MCTTRTLYIYTPCNGKQALQYRNILFGPLRHTLCVQITGNTYIHTKRRVNFEILSRFSTDSCVLSVSLRICIRLSLYTLCSHTVNSISLIDSVSLFSLYITSLHMASPFVACVFIESFFFALVIQYTFRKIPSFLREKKNNLWAIYIYTG